MKFATVAVAALVLLAAANARAEGALEHCQKADRELRNGAAPTTRQDVIGAICQLILYSSGAAGTPAQSVCASAAQSYATYLHKHFMQNGEQADLDCLGRNRPG